MYTAITEHSFGAISHHHSSTWINQSLKTQINTLSVFRIVNLQDKYNLDNERLNSVDNVFKFGVITRQIYGRNATKLLYSLGSKSKSTFAPYFFVFNNYVL